MKIKRKYHGFIPKFLLLVLIIIGSLSTNFNKPQNHIILASKNNNASLSIQKIDLSNSHGETCRYALRNYDEKSKNLLIQSNKGYYTLILTDLRKLKEVVTLLNKENIKSINNVIIIGTNLNVLKSIKYDNIYLLNDKSNLDLKLSTLGTESNLQSLSIHYNKNAEPSTKVVVRTQKNNKNIKHESSSTYETWLVLLMTGILFLILELFLHRKIKKLKNAYPMIKTLLKNTWNELDGTSKVFIGILWVGLCREIYVFNGYDLNWILLGEWLIISILIIFIAIVGAKGYKLIKSIDKKRFNDLPRTLIFLLSITGYCAIMVMCLNNTDAVFSNMQKKVTLIIPSLCLIISYIYNMRILYNLIMHRCKVVKDSTQIKQFVNFCFLALFVIMCFICIFTSANLLILYNNPDAFKCTLLDSCSVFDVIYYSASTFLTFCSENVSANTVLSKLICLLSKSTTIVGITVLLSVLTASLPDDVNESDNNTDEEDKTDKTHKNKKSIKEMLKGLYSNIKKSFNHKTKKE